MKKEKQKKLWHTDFNWCILSLSNSKLINSILKLFLAAFVRRTISFGSCINAVLLPLSDVVEYKDLLTKINLSSRTLKLTHTHTHTHTHTLETFLRSDLLGYLLHTHTHTHTVTHSHTRTYCVLLPNTHTLETFLRSDLLGYQLHTPTHYYTHTHLHTHTHGPIAFCYLTHTLETFLRSDLLGYLLHTHTHRDDCSVDEIESLILDTCYTHTVTHTPGLIPFCYFTHTHTHMRSSVESTWSLTLTTCYTHTHTLLHTETHLGVGFL